MTRTFSAHRRPRKSRTALSFVAVLLLTSGLAASSHAQPQEPELLPVGAAREVIGVWQLIEPPLPCTRAIELVDSKPYMVARCSDNPAADGSRGFPIARLGPSTYQGRAGQRYEIRRDGWLYMLDGSHVSMRARPITAPAPR